MKKILLFTAITGIGFLILSSYRSGPANNGYDCTGAETGLSNPTGCGGGCHGLSATAGINVSVELDSAGVPVTNYIADSTYTIKIKGINTTANNLPKFGFQVGAIKGSSAVTTPVNAGTLQSTGLHAGVRYKANSAGNYVVNLVEQSTQLSPASGTGGTGTVYADSFTWVAPVAGTGTVSIWGVMNAVNNNGNNDAGDKWNLSHIVINEEVDKTLLNTISNSFSALAYPNPFAGSLTLSFDNAPAGNYDIHVYSIDGKLIASQIKDLAGNNQLSFNSGNWAPGLYHVVIKNEGKFQLIPVLKN